MDFDPDNPAGAAAVEATINAAGIWTGPMSAMRTCGLRFLNVEGGCSASRVAQTLAGECSCYNEASG